MRCSACGDVWFQTPPPEPEIILEPEPPIRLLAAPSAPVSEGRARTPRRLWRERPRTVFAASGRAGGLRPGLERFLSVRALTPRWRGVRGWLVVAMIFAAPLGGALLFRADIVNKWPKAARVYSALGIPVTSSGLLIHADYSKVLRDGKHMIEVRGEIENQGRLAREVPRLQLALYDPQERRELYRWVVPVNRAPLDPKGKRAFRTSFPAPPRNVNVHIHFAETEEE